MITFSKNW